MIDFAALRHQAPIGLGLAALGRPGYINLGHAEDLEREYGLAAMEARTHAVLDAAWAAGVRYFDAARSYGRAEDFLGDWLGSRRLARESVGVGSKWGYAYTAGWSPRAEKHEIKEHDLATLCRQIGESRARLGAHLDLYQIHSATRESGVLEKGEVLAELARLRGEGLVIGLSVSGAEQADTIHRALQIEVDGVRLFQSVQATWNVLEPSAGPALRQAHEAGLAVIIKEGLANGRLTARNTDSAFEPTRRRLEVLASRQGSTIDALALAAVRSQPWVDVVLSGAATVEQLRSNLAAARFRLDEATERELDELAEPPSAYWQTRSALPWN